MPAYYNEIDSYCCEWLENLMAAGHIPMGWIDDRPIQRVSPEELANYTQCHFFAGIGGWAYALRLSGWLAERPVWTGSCPCQPFSAAGQRRGIDDERHLWPEFLRLIHLRRPSVVLGEQVASRDGRRWLSGVQLDLEALGYAVGATDLCAAGVGAPHIRQRLYWVGSRMADSYQTGRQSSAPVPREPTTGNTPTGQSEQLGPSGFWSGYDLLPCLDGKSRRVEPGTFPLAHGIPARMGKLRAYGNAIVPQVAAEFIKAYLWADEGLTHV